MPAPAAPTQGISYQLRPIGGSSATGAGTDGGRRHRLARAPKMRDSAQAMVQHVGLAGALCRPVRARASQAFRRARGHRATIPGRLVSSDRERTIAIPENTSPPPTSSNASPNRPPNTTARWGGRRRLPRIGEWHGEATGGGSVETGKVGHAVAREQPGRTCPTPPVNGLVQMLNGPILYIIWRKATWAQNHHRGPRWAFKHGIPVQLRHGSRSQSTPPHQKQKKQKKQKREEEANQHPCFSWVFSKKNPRTISKRSKIMF